LGALPRGGLVGRTVDAAESDGAGAGEEVAEPDAEVKGVGAAAEGFALPAGLGSSLAPAVAEAATVGPASVGVAATESRARSLAGAGLRPKTRWPKTSHAPNASAAPNAASAKGDRLGRSA
jgi:hypothetical protein